MPKMFFICCFSVYNERKKISIHHHYVKVKSSVYNNRSSGKNCFTLKGSEEKEHFSDFPKCGSKLRFNLNKFFPFMVERLKKNVYILLKTFHSQRNENF